MLRSVVVASVMLVTSLLTSATASAGILPCTGNSVVKVVDMYYPRGIEDRHLASLREKRVHLGYRFNGCSGGAWVGYVADDKPWIPLNDNQLRAMLFIAGMNELPPAPSYWSSPENHRIGLMWLILGLVLIIAATLQQMGVMSKKSDDAADESAVPEAIVAAAAPGLATATAGVPTTYKSALAAIERAASESGRIVVSGPVASKRSPGSRHATAPRFGKR